jgi:mannose-6-phosphate isomerase-like protein (cupin superfamily)
VEIIEFAGKHTAVGHDHWVEHFRVPDLSIGTYSIPAGGTDPQSPHTEDELYVCTTGRATLWTPSRAAEMTPGVVAFVPAGEEHRFQDVREDFTVIVVFGPAEETRLPETPG